MMSLNREEIAADLLWRYVDHVRASEAEPLSDQELEEVADLMKGAAPLGAALAEPELDERRSAVRARLDQVLASHPQPEAREPVPVQPRIAAPLVPAWRFRVACGLAMTLALALGSISLWYHPRVPVTTRVQYVAVPKDVRGIEAMDERRAHDLLPRMIHNQLPPKIEKDLMGHMLVCPGCFNDYVHLKHQHTPQQMAGEPFHLVSR